MTGTMTFDAHEYFDSLSGHGTYSMNDKNVTLCDYKGIIINGVHIPSCSILNVVELYENNDDGVVTILTRIGLTD